MPEDLSYLNKTPEQRADERFIFIFFFFISTIMSIGIIGGIWFLFEKFL